MNISAYRGQGGGQGERLPFLETLMKKEGQTVKGKIIAARQVKTPKFNGLFLDVKVNGTKYSKGIKFDPSYDLDALATAMKSDDTDDWIGQTVTFVGNKGKKGKTLFANIQRPKQKKR